MGCCGGNRKRRVTPVKHNKHQHRVIDKINVDEKVCKKCGILLHYKLERDGGSWVRIAFCPRCDRE